jgi:hypothetical protein
MLVVLVPVIGLMLVSAGRRGPEDELGAEVIEFLETPAHRPRPEILRAFVSLAFMLGGAELMVVSAVDLATGFGLAQGFAGLTLVGIGTSAPLSLRRSRRPGGPSTISLSATCSVGTCSSHSAAVPSSGCCLGAR